MGGGGRGEGVGWGEEGGGGGGGGRGGMQRVEYRHKSSLGDEGGNAFPRFWSLCNISKPVTTTKTLSV